MELLKSRAGFDAEHVAYKGAAPAVQDVLGGQVGVMMLDTATALPHIGLRPGDSALFQMGTGIDTARALLGCFKAGVLPVCTIAHYRAVEIEALAGATRPKAVHGASVERTQIMPGSFRILRNGRCMGTDRERMANTLLLDQRKEGRDIPPGHQHSQCAIHG